MADVYLFWSVPSKCRKIVARIVQIVATLSDGTR